MASYKEIRNRLSTIISIRQVTSAMKMVSAAKLRKSQDAIVQIRPYSEKLHEILTNLSSGLDPREENIFARQKEVNRVLIVPITSNRGLCGSFNSGVVKKTIDLAHTKYRKQFDKGNVSIIAIGKNGMNQLKKKKFNILSSYNEIYDNLNFETICPVAETVMEGFTGNQFDRVYLVYNQFKNAAVHTLTIEQFLPIMKKEDTEKEKGKPSHLLNYLFEPNKEYIVDVLIPKSLKIQFFKALLDSFASEHGARMTAMHKATDNATDMIRDLRLQYNKVRQATITKELLEIVSGAEALK